MIMYSPDERATEGTMSPHGVRRAMSVSPVQNDPVNTGKIPIQTCLPIIARLSHPANYYNSAKLAFKHCLIPNSRLCCCNAVS